MKEGSGGTSPGRWTNHSKKITRMHQTRGAEGISHAQEWVADHWHVHATMFGWGRWNVGESHCTHQTMKTLLVVPLQVVEEEELQVRRNKDTESVVPKECGRCHTHSLCTWFAATLLSQTQCGPTKTVKTGEGSPASGRDVLRPAATVPSAVWGCRSGEPFEDWEGPRSREWVGISPM